LLAGDDSRDRALRDAANRGQLTGEALNRVRTLTDTPAGHLTPSVFADAIAADAADAGVTAHVWSQEQIRERGFGGLLAVAQGSVELPQVVELCYGDQSNALGLTGKGITFDAGGINLKKPLSEVHWMKSDMASAAAVAGADFAAAKMNLEVGVCAILPITENMVSGSAIRPGDIAIHPNKMTTEILDTDCEGRVILADGIAYLSGKGVNAIIDVGTLTDAAGYGPDLWAGASTNYSLMGEALAAGYLSGDRGWQMPLVAGYVEMMRSQHADLINGPISISDSSVLAATYLREFAGTTPWLHMDVGSKAYITTPWAGWPAGATGAPMRVLLRLLEQRAQSA
jgi:leucyl aminopeptidase